MQDGVARTALDALRQHGTLLGGLTLAGVLGALVLAVATPPTYEAQAIVYVDPAAQSGTALQASDGLLARYWMEQVTSPRILDRARQSLGPRGGQVSEATVGAAPVRSTNTFAVTGRGPSPQVAADVANAVAAATRDVNREEASARYESQLKYLNAELDRLNNAIATETRPEVVATYRNQQLEAYTNLQTVTLAQTREMDALSVLEPAALPSKPVAPSLPLYLGAGLAGGLVTGVMAALLRARFDDHLQEPEELRIAAGVGLVVPLGADPGNGAIGRSDVGMAQLLAHNPDARFILLAGESAAQAALLLGSAAERSGRRALVVLPAAVPDPASGRRLGVQPTTLTADSALAIEHALAESRAFEISLVAVPAPTAGPAAVSLARYFDLAVLVATRSTTRLGEVRVQAAEMKAAGGRLAAAVLLQA